MSKASKTTTSDKSIPSPPKKFSDVLFEKSLESEMKDHGSAYNKLLKQIETYANENPRSYEFTVNYTVNEKVVELLRKNDGFIVTCKIFAGRSNCGCDFGCAGCTSTASTTISWDKKGVKGT